MTKKQYQQVVRNRGRMGARPAIDGWRETGLLRAAARDLRQRVLAQEVLERILPSEWLEIAHVEMLKEGTLFISVADAAVGERIRRQHERLKKELARKLPFIQRVRVGPSGPMERTGELS